MDSNQAWLAMYRRIPADLHDGLTISMRSGAEIVIQTILKLEPDFIILRGRLTGTQEGGKILLIPYQEMTVALLPRSLKDLEVEAIFGKGAPPVLADAPVAAGDKPDAPPAAPAKDATVNDAPAPVNPAKAPEAVSKQALLAKLRQQMKDSPASTK